MIELRYRTWTPAVPPPRRVRLDIPGWAGAKDHDAAHPWHCKPWIDAATLGFELVWGVRTTAVVTGDGETARVEGDYDQETHNRTTISQFARGHYGIQSHHQITVPPGWGLLVQPHPRWHLDPYRSELPAIVPGLIEAAWWPELFFVVAAVPPAGIRHVFRYGEPFATVLPIPLDVTRATLSPQSPEEVETWKARDQLIRDGYERLATRHWETTDGKQFSNIYKLASGFMDRGRRDGWPAIQEHAIELEARQAVLRPDHPDARCPFQGHHPEGEVPKEEAEAE